MKLEEYLAQKGIDTGDVDPRMVEFLKKEIPENAEMYEADNGADVEIVPEKYELTPEEEMLLCSVYVDEDRILDGLLFSHQIEALNALRFGHQYLENKYPGIKFVFHMFAPADRLNPDNRITFSVEDDERLFQLKVRKIVINDKTESVSEEETDIVPVYDYEARDDFYKTLVRDDYDEMLQDLIRSAMGINSLVYTDFTELRGSDIDGRTSVNELIAEKDNLSRQTRVFLDRNDVEDNTVSGLRELFKDKGLYGSYGVYYAGGLLYGQTDPEELMKEVVEVERSVVNREYFNCFDI